MRGRILVAAMICLGVMGAVLSWGPAVVPARSTSPVAHGPAREPTGGAPSREAAATTRESASTGDPKPEPGVVRGRLLYDDSSAAAGLTVSLDHGRYVTASDAEGAFRIRDVPPGWHRLRVGVLDLGAFALRPGQEHTVEHVVPRGAAVSGTVVATEDGRPLLGRTPCLFGDHVTASTLTSEEGTFRFDWVPVGAYQLLVYGGDDRHRTESVAVNVASAAVDLRIATPMDPPPLRVRFDDLPVEWRATIPLFIEIRDDAGRCHTLEPGDAIGSPGGPGWTDVDRAGRPLYPPAMPTPGRYVLALRHLAWEVPYLEVPFESPACENLEILVRIPDGARVVVSQIGNLTSRLGKHGGLAIGSACESLYAESTAVVLPRVPAGHHTIWKTSTWSVVRIGEIDIPTSGDVSYTPDHDLSAGIRGVTDGGRPIRLVRMADDSLVAWNNEGSPQIAFSPLAPGRYVLVVDERRIPVEVNANQVIDFGYAFAR